MSKRDFNTSARSQDEHEEKNKPAKTTELGELQQDEKAEKDEADKQKDPNRPLGTGSAVDGLPGQQPFESNPARKENQES